MPHISNAMVNPTLLNLWSDSPVLLAASKLLSWVREGGKLSSALNGCFLAPYKVREADDQLDDSAAAAAAEEEEEDCRYYTAQFNRPLLHVSSS